MLFDLDKARRHFDEDVRFATLYANSYKKKYEDAIDGLLRIKGQIEFRKKTVLRFANDLGERNLVKDEASMFDNVLALCDQTVRAFKQIRDNCKY